MIPEQDVAQTRDFLRGDSFPRSRCHLVNHLNVVAWISLPAFIANAQSVSVSMLGQIPALMLCSQRSWGW